MWPAELGLECLRCVHACVVHETGVAVGMLAYSGINEVFQRQRAGGQVKVVISGLSRPDRDGWQVSEWFRKLFIIGGALYLNYIV